MNIKTVALTKEQYQTIIQTMKQGFTGCRPNERIATALTLEANLGLRISDILKLTLNDIIKDGNRYRLDITEQKTGKKRMFTVPTEIYQYIKIYCLENGIQRHEKIVCDYLGYDNISTHSFRKMFASQIYQNNDYNIILVQQLLQHSTPAVTQKYIGISSKDIETALSNHICLK